MHPRQFGPIDHSLIQLRGVGGQLKCPPRDRGRQVKRTLAFGLTVTLLLMPASAASASGPAITETISVVGDQFVCEDDTYTIVSGDVRFTLHEGESASGNQNFTVTIAATKVEAVNSSGESFFIVGAFWAGFTANAKTGGFQGTTTDHFQIIGQGEGTVDSVQVTTHITFRPPDNFNVKDFNFGTCASPED
jgi:hypothetical protein